MRIIRRRVRASRVTGAGRAWGLLMALTACLPAAAQDSTRILLFHKQNGYIHTATPTVVAALRSDWRLHGFAVETTIDSLAFTTENLSRFAAVAFLNTNYRNGPLLTRAQEAAFENYLRAGGAFIGLHSAIPLNGTMEEGIWPWYAGMYGARFRSHAPYRGGTLIVEDSTHPATQGRPTRITVQDEWYALQANPRTVPGVHVLATVDESDFLPDSHMGGDHPVTWVRAFEGGRVWVTVVGHDMGAFSNAGFISHVRGGVLWATSDEVASTRGARGLRETRGRHDSRRPTALSYRGAGGEWLEVRVDGRTVTARRGAP